MNTVQFDAVTLLAGLGLTVSLMAIAWVDARTLRIPDAISLPLICAGLLLSLLAGNGTDRLIGAAAGFAVLGGIGEIYHRRTGRDGLGLGDAKLFSAAGAWVGWQALPQVLLVASVAGLIFALLRRRNVGPIAFGPWLAVGFWLVWVAEQLMARIVT